MHGKKKRFFEWRFLEWVDGLGWAGYHLVSPWMCLRSFLSLSEYFPTVTAWQAPGLMLIDLRYPMVFFYDYNRPLFYTSLPY